MNGGADVASANSCAAGSRTTSPVFSCVDMRCSSVGVSDLGEAFDEVERRLGDLAPAAVDRQGVPAVGHAGDFGHSGIALLLLEGGLDDRPRNGVVSLA